MVHGTTKKEVSSKWKFCWFCSISKFCWSTFFHKFLAVPKRIRRTASESSFVKLSFKLSVKLARFSFSTVLKKCPWNLLRYDSYTVSLSLVMYGHFLQVWVCLMESPHCLHPQIPTPSLSSNMSIWSTHLPLHVFTPLPDILLGTALQICMQSLGMSLQIIT